MELDETIVQLGARLDGWLDANLATLASQDRASQVRALNDGRQLAKELDAIKAQGLEALATIIKRQSMISQTRDAASLVEAFAFGAKLAATLHDELLDTDGYNKAVLRMNEICEILDTLESGRAALAALLDHGDARVRASAGAYLINLMPDRVVPILREIDNKEGGTSADFTAHWALLDWDIKQRSDKNRGQNS